MPNTPRSQQPDPRPSQLSPARQRLVHLLTQVHFGRIEGLHVRNGEPVFEPAPRLTRTLKVGGRNEPQITAPDTALKASIVELLTHIERLRDGIVERIEIAHGLPLLLEVTDHVESE